MKILRIAGMIMIALVMSGQSLLFAQKQDEKDEVAEKIIEMVSNKEFSINVNRAIPMTGPLVNLSTSYSLKVKDDTVISAMPYYGRAYSLPYDGGVGLDFKGTVSDFSFDKNKKGTLSIQFNTRSEDDSYQFKILLYTNKSALIYVQPTYKQSISFQGYLELDD